MVLSPLNMLYRNLGIHTVENETSIMVAEAFTSTPKEA